MTAIRAGRGLGDSLYLQSIVRYMVERGERVQAYSDWPDVFRPLGERVAVHPFRRGAVDRVAHYVTRKTITGTTQFQDMCIHAGLPSNIDLRLDWVRRDAGIADQVERSAGDLPIVLVQMPREPFGREDGFGRDLLPKCTVIQQVLDRLKGRAFLVEIGAGETKFEFSGIDCDLRNKTRVSELLDLAVLADGCVGYCSFIVPLAESLGKPELLVWSRRGLNSATDYVRSITPQKIIHRPDMSRAVIDDCTDDELSEATDAFYREVGGRAAVRRQARGSGGERPRCAA